MKTLKSALCLPVCIAGAEANRLSEEQREKIWPKGYGSEADRNLTSQFM